MDKEHALLFLPDISGFTQFVQNTEVEHSQHVIAELLEILLDANILDLQLAEIEGDALFYYRDTIPSRADLLKQVDAMFNAFYEHLAMLEQNRICPCNACATAPNLQLKIVGHAGPLQFINVQNTRKPFGTHVIEAHRLMKNSVNSDSYLLLSKDLFDQLDPPELGEGRYSFAQASNSYDRKTIDYCFALVDGEHIKSTAIRPVEKMSFDRPPNIEIAKEYSCSAETLFELVSNYSYRQHWVRGVDDFGYNENEATRLGTEHTCVINGRTLDFVAITKDVDEGRLVYGEKTTSMPQVDELYQFIIIDRISDTRCSLLNQFYWKINSPLKETVLSLVLKPRIRKNSHKSLKLLADLVESTKRQVHLESVAPY